MRLPDLMRREAAEAPLDERVVRELRALDAGLAGQRPEPGLEPLAELAGELRADRPVPDPEFAAALDAWAAAGCPRGKRPGAAAADDGAAGALARLRELLAATPPRRLAAPVAAATTLVVVAGVAISQNSGTDGDPGAPATPLVAPAEPEQAIEPSPPLRPGAGEEAATIEPAGAPALGEDRRRVERDAQLTLAAEADEVPEIAGAAIDVVEGYGGVVRSSQVRGDDDSASATLALAIPTRRLDAALADLSDLAEVRSRSEGSLDITRPFVSAREVLAGLRAERESVLARLEAADTAEEARELRLRLDVLNRDIARARSDVERLVRRSRLAEVSLQIASHGAEQRGGWGLEDAVDDAGRVLTVIAGVALVSAAVLLPIALLAAIAVLVGRAALGRARERALD